MKKKFKLSEEQALILPFVLIGTLCVLVAVVIACVQDTTITDYSIAVWELGKNLFACGVILLIFVPTVVFLALVTQHIDWEVVKSTAKRLGGDLSNSILMKNSQVLSYRLKFFLYGVLSRNNQVLHLPLGEDFSCLTPRELVYSCRGKCVFYNYDLIIPEKPEMDMGTLRKIVQGCIENELLNYKITALEPCFYSKAMGCIFGSVYLDRAYYNEAQHRLTFEVLYVCTEDAAEYLVKAIQRDAVKVHPEREFFDDDL